MTAELEPEQRPQFSGEFSLRKFGAASLIELRAPPYHVERSASDIAKAPGGSLCIYQQLGGGGRFGVDGSGDFTTHSGAFATSHSDLPYRTVPLAADGFHLRIVKLPAADALPPKAALRHLVPRPFGDLPWLLPLLESCFSDLVDANDDADLAETAPLVQALAQFVLIERGIVRPGHGAAREAIRVGRLSLARRLIARHLSQSGLSPSWVAESLGISVRHLHALFEPTGASFSQTVTALRVERSRRLLNNTPQRPVSQIAVACGFDSLATFYRAFHAALGMSPGDFRTQAGLDGHMVPECHGGGKSGGTGP